MKTMKTTQALLDTFRRTTSVIDLAWCRTEATRDPMSWTPPTKIEPRTIQTSAGTHPNTTPARIGPVMGPAAAMVEKCCPTRNRASTGTSSTPSFLVTAGVSLVSSSRKTFRARKPP